MSPKLVPVCEGRRRADANKQGAKPRFFSSALLPFFREGFPYLNRLQKKKKKTIGSLILTSLPEDLEADPGRPRGPGANHSAQIFGSWGAAVARCSRGCSRSEWTNGATRLKRVAVQYTFVGKQ